MPLTKPQSVLAEPVRAKRGPVVLIANDQEWVPRSLESILLPEGFEVVRVYTGRQALERVAAVNPDLIILDAQMPDLDGFEVCRRMRADPVVDAVVPIIISTAGAANRAQRVEAYRSGAWAFYNQPFDGELLLAQFRTFLVSKEAFDSARAQSMTDGLTGLYTSFGLAQRAREIASEAHRGHTALACVVLKPESANGDLGDAAQLQLAQWIGALLRREGRSADAIGRVGPVQFAVVAPRTNPEGAEKLARRFDALLQASSSADRVMHPMRLRAGYCAVPDFTKSDADALEMLSRASAALVETAPGERIRAA
jgi:PleD family two-component response regulator